MKTACIILADGFEEVEAVTPADLLRRAGVQVVLAGLKTLHPKGARGISVICDGLLETLTGPFDLLVLPGGLPGARHLAQSPEVDSWIRATLETGGVVGAICAAPALVLGSRGFLKGKAFTGYPGTETQVTEARFQEAPVVIDGNLITSRGVGTAGAFSLALIERLMGRDKAEEVGRAVLLL